MPMSKRAWSSHETDLKPFFSFQFEQKKGKFLFQIRILNKLWLPVAADSPNQGCHLAFQKAKPAKLAFYEIVFWKQNSLAIWPFFGILLNGE